MRVSIVGAGYVGLVSGVGLAELGHDVVCVDMDSAKVETILRGEPPIHEDGLEPLLERHLGKRFTATGDLAAAVHRSDLTIIAVGTPFDGERIDLRQVRGVAQEIGAALRDKAGWHAVIVKSTVVPGTTDSVVLPILEERSGLSAGADFHVGYSPERLEPGNTAHGLVSTPKLVSGIDPESLRVVQSFYDRIVDTTQAVANPKVAELAKLLENTFRHVNIALVNEMAMFANDLGIDVWDVIEAASTKPFGFMRFEPGPGVGGHCLPSTRATCPGRFGAASASRSASSSSPTMSTTTCPTTW